jgi:signal transduction histidine kinase
LLVLEVGDDGAGAPSAKAARPGGIGLATVRQRLQARFGAAADTAVITAPNEGFTVRLRLPAEPHRVAPAAARDAQPEVARD